MQEQFRGVVWPRPEVLDNNGKPAYRYVVVGMLVTDTPIEGLHPNETVLDGVVERYVSEMGFAGAIQRAPKFQAATPLGDATSVLLRLEGIVGEPLTRPPGRPAALAGSTAPVAPPSAKPHVLFGDRDPGYRRFHSGIQGQIIAVEKRIPR